MSRCVEAPPNSGGIINDFTSIIPTTWTNAQTTTSASNTLLLIAVEYVRDNNDFKYHSVDNSFNSQMITSSSSIFEQQVSPLDPNMSSAAQYSPGSPTYPCDDTSLSNAVVVQQLISKSRNSPIHNRSFIENCTENEITDTVLANNSHLLKEVVTDELLLNQENVSAQIAENTLPLVTEPEQEVELLITDQETGISYSVCAQEYLVERCLADEQHLLDALTPDPLLDPDLLALDESTLKCELKDIDVSTGTILDEDDSIAAPADSNLDLGNVEDKSKIEPPTESELVNSLEKDVLLHRSQRQNDTNLVEKEETLLQPVHMISDKPVPTRARASLPASYLVINKQNNAYGVFARKLIQRRIQFGPVEGKLVSLDSNSDTSDLRLLLEIEPGKCMQLDVSDENNANWMCFVRKAKTYNEQNLVVSQLGSSLYYTTTKTILPKQELLVGYSASYAQKHNLPTLQPAAAPLQQANDWPCFECGESFGSSEQLQTHLNVHDEVCVETRQQTKKPPHKHRSKIRRSQRPRLLECRTCHATFPNFKFNLFLAHLTQHGIDESKSVEGKEVKVSICDECELLFPNTETLAIHQLEHKKDLQRKEMLTDCPCCSQDFSQVQDLVSHIVQHAVGMLVPQALKGYKCPVCHKIFASRERIQRHMMVHGSEESKPLKCETCGKRFLNNSALACHLKTHSIGKTMFECPICKESFHHVLQLKVHVPRHCKNGVYTCPHCGKIFKEYSIIRKHIRAFHCERKHNCPHCSKLFPTLDKLRMHLLRHSDHREFLCADCGKQFKRKDKLKEHTKRLHAEERGNVASPRPPKVVHPQKKFTPKVQPTDYHRFIYKCHTCLVGFKRRGMLVNHLAKRHPDISPDSVPELNLPILRTTRDYYCQYCDKVYKSSSKRKAHILKNHPGQELPLSNRKVGSFPEIPGLPNPTFSQTVGSVTTRPQACQWCHKQYASKAKLLQHQRKKHPEQLRDNSLSNPSDKGTAKQRVSLEDGNIGEVVADEARSCFKRELKVTDDELFSEVVTLNGDKTDSQYFHVISVPSNDGATPNINNNDPNSYYSRLYRSLAANVGFVPPR